MIPRLMAIIRRMFERGPNHCMCPACCDGATHDSDCAVHNMPADPNGECNCGRVDIDAKRAARDMAVAMAVAQDVFREMRERRMVQREPSDEEVCSILKSIIAGVKP